MKKTITAAVLAMSALFLTSPAYAVDGDNIVGDAVNGVEDVADGVLGGAEDIVNGAGEGVEDILGGGDNVTNNEDLPNDNNVAGDTLGNGAANTANGANGAESAATNNPTTGANDLIAVGVTAAASLGAVYAARRRK